MSGVGTDLLANVTAPKGGESGQKSNLVLAQSPFFLGQRGAAFSPFGCHGTGAQAGTAPVADAQMLGQGGRGGDQGKIGDDLAEKNVRGMALGQEQMIEASHAKPCQHGRVDLVNGGMIDKSGKAVIGKIAAQAGEKGVVQLREKDVIVFAHGVGGEVAMRSVGRGRQIRDGKQADVGLALFVRGKAGTLQKIRVLDRARIQRQNTAQINAVLG